jgi:hypothetical protein
MHGNSAPLAIHGSGEQTMNPEVVGDITVIREQGYKTKERIHIHLTVHFVLISRQKRAEFGNGRHTRNGRLAK